jgi:hypothetical protein
VSSPGRGERAPFTGRAAYGISQIYYYAAAVVGVGFVIGGGISALIELRHLTLPERTTVFGSDTTRASVHGIMVGLAFLIPGLAAALWHLKEAGRRERRFVPGAFWGERSTSTWSRLSAW